MCTIRIIRRTASFEINDQVIDLKDININPIDRPAYVLYLDDINTYAMEFVFTSDKEERAKYQFNDIYMEYGVNSGRVYKILSNKKEINQTDLFHIIKDSITNLSTEQFKENIKCFINICNQINVFVINNSM